MAYGDGLQRVLQTAGTTSQFLDQRRRAPMVDQSLQTDIKQRETNLDQQLKEIEESGELKLLATFMAIPDPAGQERFLMDTFKRKQLAGEDTTRLARFIDLPPQQRNQEGGAILSAAYQTGSARAPASGSTGTAPIQNMRFRAGLTDPKDVEIFDRLTKSDDSWSPLTVGGAKFLFNNRTKEMQPLSTAEQETQAAATKARQIATAEGEARLEVARPEKEAKERKRKTAIRQAGNTVVQDLGRALEMLPDMNQGTGPVGANVRLAKANISGTTEAKMKLFIDSALSNVGLDRLQQMRESSPTGGALGQVPIAQQLRLEKVLGSMDLGQEPQVIEENMKRVMNVYFDIMNGDAEEREYLVKEGKMTQAESDKIDSYYFDLSFDELGRQRGAEATPQPSHSGIKFLGFE